MEINWTMLTYAVIALFALSGFYKGWWKEAITAAFLALLMLLLKSPELAQSFVDGINWFVEVVWRIVPDSIKPTLEQVFDVGPGAVPIIDASDPTTWLIILVFLMLVSIIVSRSSLPNFGPGRGYEVRPMGSVLGGLLGGLNGFIVMGLIRAYLNGSNLPGNGTGAPPTEIVTAAGGTIGVATTDVVITATDVPAFTLLDSYLPWVLMVLGGMVFIMALTNRVGMSTKDGYRKFSPKKPYGYREYGS
jgi:hypothetical protein